VTIPKEFLDFFSGDPAAVEFVLTNARSYVDGSRDATPTLAAFMVGQIPTVVCIDEGKANVPFTRANWRLFLATFMPQSYTDVVDVVQLHRMPSRERLTLLEEHAIREGWKRRFVDLTASDLWTVWCPATCAWLFSKDQYARARLATFGLPKVAVGEFNLNHTLLVRGVMFASVWGLAAFPDSISEVMQWGVGEFLAEHPTW